MNGTVRSGLKGWVQNEVSSGELPNNQGENIVFRTKIAQAAFCGLLLAVATQASAQTVSNAYDVRNLLKQDGYASIRDVEFKAGLWTAEATTTTGQRVDVLVDPATGVTTPFYTRSQDELNRSLQTIYPILLEQGYRDFREVEIDDGLWEAEAFNRNNQWVDITVHPFTGAVLREKLEWDDDYLPDHPNNPPAGYLGADQIVSILTATGYTRIHELELDDGYWEAEARNQYGLPVDLKIDRITGAVVREEVDFD